MSTWYAVKTRSNYEHRVAQDLMQKGIECYLPIFRQLHHWKDRAKVVEVPVFRGYVFTSFEDGPVARLAIVRSDGVASILGMAGTPTPIPDDEIESVRHMLSKTSGRCLVHPLLVEGAWVRVRRGALKGMEGVLTRTKSQTRLVVSITLLSQSVSADVSVADVEFVRSASVAKRKQVA